MLGHVLITFNFNNMTFESFQKAIQLGAYKVATILEDHLSSEIKK